VIGDVLRLEDVGAIDGVTLLDDPHETVIATVSAPRVEVEPVAEVEGEEVEEGEAVEGEEAAAAGEAPAAEESPAEE
jgi:hypothetical protein